MRGLVLRDHVRRLEPRLLSQRPSERLFPRRQTCRLVMKPACLIPASEGYDAPAPMSHDLIVEVCSREEAGEILSSPHRRADVCFLVSIGAPEDRPPAGYANVRDKLRLLFADATDESGPNEEDVAEIIAAAKALEGRSGRVVIHCQAGISRSSAAAVIVHAVHLGPGREVEAVRRVLAQREIADPNRKMIDLADRLLARDGRLRDAVEEVFGD